MSRTLEHRLSNLIREIGEIKKELISQKYKIAESKKHRINTWETLCKKVSSKWDNVSAVEEISLQREKTW
jgi:hypothetical protein